MYYYRICMEDYEQSLVEECASEAEFYPCPAVLMRETDVTQSTRMCPTFRPFLCPDGLCVRHSSDCKTIVPCGYGQIRCPDGTCANSVKSCGTMVTCPASRPILCEDLSCKMNEKDCVRMESCPSETPFRCPDTSCVKNHSECPAGRICDASTPILCDDGNCYPDEENVCENLDTKSCPRGRVRCWDNSCRVSLSLCPERYCSPSLPYMCQTGRCVTDPSICPVICEDATLCALPPQLGSDRFQYVVVCCNGLERDQCCGFPQTNEVCPEGEVRCPNGVCRREEECMNGYNCPKEYPYRCSNNKCVSDPMACMGLTSCGDGWVRCPAGTCAASYGDCRLLLTYYDGLCMQDKPIRCPDGNCAKTLLDVVSVGESHL